MKPNQPAVSRDTRLLLTIIVIAVATLWALARLRFPDQLATPNPVPPVLAQLTQLSAFDDITSAVARLQTQLQPLVVALTVDHLQGTATFAPRTTVSALRFREDLAVALIGGKTGAEWPGATVVGGSEVARDRASQLLVVRLPGDPAALLSTWSPRDLSYPRFLLAADPSTTSLLLRPVFIDSLQAVVTPIWLDPLWVLPEEIDLAPGTFMFTTDGALAGLVVEREGGPALVPANTIIAAADRLARRGPEPPGWIGVDVQPLSAALAAATGAGAGVIVTRVDPQGPAAGELGVTDLVERIDGGPTPTLEHWTARIERVVEGESLVITARQGGVVRDVHLVAAAAVATASLPLGLAIRTIPQIGVEVVRVDAQSAAALAGLRVGDVVTVAGNVAAPTAAQTLRALAAASRDRPIVLAVTRAGTHHVLAIEKTW